MDVLRTGGRSPVEGVTVAPPPVGSAVSAAEGQQVGLARWQPQPVGRNGVGVNAQLHMPPELGLVTYADAPPPGAADDPTPSYYRWPLVAPFRSWYERPLPVSPVAPKQARRFVNGRMEEYAEGQRFDDEQAAALELLVSEAVTNAFRHGFKPNDSVEAKASAAIEPAIWLGVACLAGCMVVAVLDKARTPLKVDPPDLKRASNRGLQLINELAEGMWGYYFTEMGGKVVWFCVTRMNKRGAEKPPVAAAAS